MQASTTLRSVQSGHLGQRPKHNRALHWGLFHQGVRSRPEPNRPKRWGPFNQDVSGTDRNPTVQKSGVGSTRTSRAPTGTRPSKSPGSVQPGRLGHRPESDRNPTVQNAGVRSTRTSRAPTGTQPSTTLGSVQPGRLGPRPEPNRPQRWGPFNQDGSGTDRTQPCTTLGSVQPRRLGTCQAPTGTPPSTTLVFVQPEPPLFPFS